MPANRSKYFYNLIKNAITSIAGSPLEFYETSDFSTLSEGTKPRISLELLSDIKDDLYRGSIKTRTNGTVEYQLLCGFRVQQASKDEDGYIDQMYSIPEILEKALQTIELPNNFRIDGEDIEISIRKIGTPNHVFTQDIDSGSGYLFFNGQLEYWKL